MRLRLALLAASIIGAIPAAAGAQVSSLRPGVTVRFWRTGDQDREQGRIVRASSDTLWLGGCGYGCTVPVGLRDITEIDREVRAPASGSRQLVGMLIGAVAGAGLVTLDAFTCDKSHDDGPGCGLVIILAPPAAILGGTIGYLAARVIGKNEWQPVFLTRD